jgi:hypothetical protein
MPPTRLDAGVEPGRIQPTIRHHQHEPVRWHSAVQVSRASLPNRDATIPSDGCQALSRPLESCSPAGSPILKGQSTDPPRSLHPKPAPAACLLDVTAQSIAGVVQNTVHYPGHDRDCLPCLGHPDTTPGGVERVWLLFLPTPRRAEY